MSEQYEWLYSHRDHRTGEPSRAGLVNRSGKLIAETATTEELGYGVEYFVGLRQYLKLRES